LRDLSSKEISLFNYWSNVESFAPPNQVIISNQIENVTFNFLQNLDFEFPDTISTITRTAFKLPERQTKEKCPLCYGPVLNSEVSVVNLKIKEGVIGDRAIFEMLCYACKKLWNDVGGNIGFVRVNAEIMLEE
jgi:hypothetical protein